MKNKGLNQHRLKTCPKEKAFADEWEKINKDSDILNYIAGVKRVIPPVQNITDREREIAATVIQWLGSPVGQVFIKRVTEVLPD